MKCALCFDELPPPSDQLFCGPCQSVVDHNQNIASIKHLDDVIKSHKPSWDIVFWEALPEIVVPGATWPSVRNDREGSNYEPRCRECRRITMIEPGPGMLCGLCVRAWELLKRPILAAAWIDELDANCHVYFGNTIPLLPAHTS